MTLWSCDVIHQVGSCLIDIILTTLKLPKDAAAYKTDDERLVNYLGYHIVLDFHA